MTHFYDPPFGSKYGFPKPYKPRKGETVEDTLLRDGYPKQMLDVAKWTRFWITKDDEGEHGIQQDS